MTTETETYYRNVDVGEGDEIAVRAVKGYGHLIEIVIDGSPADVTVRLISPHAAFALGYSIMQAAKTLDPSLDWKEPFAPKQS